MIFHKCLLFPYLGPIGLVSLLVAKAMGAAQVVVSGKVFFLLNLFEVKAAGPTVCGKGMRLVPFLGIGFVKRLLLFSSGFQD